MTKSRGGRGVTCITVPAEELVSAQNMLKGSNKSTAFTHACQAAEVQCTGRQQRKFNNERGAAWRAFQKYK